MASLTSFHSGSLPPFLVGASSASKQPPTLFLQPSSPSSSRSCCCKCAAVANQSLKCAPFSTSAAFCASHCFTTLCAAPALLNPALLPKPCSLHLGMPSCTTAGWCTFTTRQNPTYPNPPIAPFSSTRLVKRVGRVNSKCSLQCS